MTGKGGSGTGVGSSAASQVNIGNQISVACQAAAHKYQRVLRALLERPHTSRELEREPVFDHCAHSTVAELRKRGIAIDTNMVEILGYAGLPARVARYTLTDEGRVSALWLLKVL